MCIRLCHGPELGGNIQLTCTCSKLKNNGVKNGATIGLSLGSVHRVPSEVSRLSDGLPDRVD